MKLFLAELKKLLSGKDGEVSLRRLMSVFLIIFGAITQVNAKVPVSNELWIVLFAFSGIILVALGVVLLLGVTAQNVMEVIGKKKG